ncbi:uncharacterized protein PHALS_03975 [Plasmopara halstedii]|uniref:Uncharacterized protein n=1 Tax=Plasmopara halstedii TaxID=4781 RepID=A0A0P1B0C4_PLAHL|nr:uncharacterized protein PHALS_03975 [Plasmopara halstedii]CEG47320.1 hypothetical protein PHALS_03975 [Plasmopara halstedii]|eukprot:XP_024583689.1 hypothetical protein PHALS_03975 [Plasmopara halstedii]
MRTATQGIALVPVAPPAYITGINKIILLGVSTSTGTSETLLSLSNANTSPATAAIQLKAGTAATSECFIRTTSATTKTVIMVSGARVITCESTGNVSIGGTTTTYKLDVGGTLNCTNLYRSGTIADITLVSGITTIGTGQASKAQKLDASRNAINIASLACDTIIANSATNILNINPTTLQLKGVALTATATQLNVLNGFTGTTANLNILSGTSVSATELNYLDVVIGTGTAFKALVLDSTRNIANVNNISCYSIDLSLHWDISIHTIIDLMDYQSIYLPVLGATAGTASPSKALVIGASRNITNIVSMTSTGDITAAGSLNGYLTYGN